MHEREKWKWSRSVVSGTPAKWLIHEIIPCGFFFFNDKRQVTTKYSANGDCLNKPWCILVTEYDTATDKNGGWSSDFVMEESPGILSEKNQVYNSVINIACYTLCKKEGRNKNIYLYLFILALQYSGKK